MTLGEGMFRGLSTDDRHDKKNALLPCQVIHEWVLFTLPENPTLSSFHGKNGETGFWANISPV